MQDVLRDMIVFNAYNHKYDQTRLKYWKLRSIIEKLRSYDEKKICFDGYNDLDYIVAMMAKTYDVHVVEYKSAMIGGLLIKSLSNDELAVSLASVLHQNYRNCGIGSELLKRAIKTCFEDYGCKKILISHRNDNPISQKITQKHGFIFTGESSSLNYRTGNVIRELHYELPYMNYCQFGNYDNVKKLVCIHE